MTIAAIAACVVLVDGQITIPNTFVNGTVADAPQVNANFTALGTGALNRAGGAMTGTLGVRDLTPSADNTYNAGTAAFRFKEVRAVDIFGAGANLTALNASNIATGTLASARGGVGIDASSPTDGQLLIGKTSDSSWNKATITAGTGISITNGAGAITVANVGSSVLDRDVTAQDVVSSAAETTVYTFSVPGGTLSTNRTLRISLIGDILSGAARTMTLKLKYGATTVLTGAVLVGGIAGRGQMMFSAEITGLNSTSAQAAKGLLTMSNVGADAAGTMLSTAPTSGFFFAGVNSGVTEDSTSSKTLAITFQNSAADASTSMRVHTVLLELL